MCHVHEFDVICDYAKWIEKEINFNKGRSKINSDSTVRFKGVTKSRS